MLPTVCPASKTLHAPAAHGAFPPSERLHVIALASSATQDHQQPDASWTLDNLAFDILRDAHHRDMSRSTIGRILSEADLKPHRSAYWLNSHDPDFDAKAENICQLYLDAPRAYEQGRLFVVELLDLVLQERRALAEIGLASLTLSILTIFPPLVIMTMVNKVLQFHSISTLVLLTAIMAVVFAYDTLLSYARRLIISVVGARLDTKLNLHLFNRLLRLPLEYFERHPAGETMHRISQIYKVREFLTGKLLTTFLDLVTLCILLPFLFYLNATLAWIVVGCAAAISLIILAYLKPMRAMFARVTAAEFGAV